MVHKYGKVTKRHEAVDDTRMIPPWGCLTRQGVSDPGQLELRSSFGVNDHKVVHAYGKMDQRPGPHQAGVSDPGQLELRLLLQAAAQLLHQAQQHALTLGCRGIKHTVDW